jgi:hypothetical protein
MRLHLHIEFETSSAVPGNLMSDWIQDIRDREDGEREKRLAEMQADIRKLEKTRRGPAGMVAGIP